MYNKRLPIDTKQAGKTYVKNLQSDKESPRSTPSFVLRPAGLQSSRPDQAEQSNVTYLRPVKFTGAKGINRSSQRRKFES